jgi:predicted SpoU family rRNA methylase
MMYKMLGIERTARTTGEKVRQVFITQSKVLAEKVEESFNNMIQSYSGDLLSAEERQWRAMMKKHAEKHLVELDAEDDNFSNVPSRFSDLEDKHFPLFVTFDKVCDMYSSVISFSEGFHSSVRCWRPILRLI